MTNRFAQKVLNPTHGSGWIGSGPFYGNIPELYFNPTHGNGWILQILSEKRREQSTNCRWWDSNAAV